MSGINDWNQPPAVTARDLPGSDEPGRVGEQAADDTGMNGMPEQQAQTAEGSGMEGMPVQRAIPLGNVEQPVLGAGIMVPEAEAAREDFGEWEELAGNGKPKQP